MLSGNHNFEIQSRQISFVGKAHRQTTLSHGKKGQDKHPFAILVQCYVQLLWIYHSHFDYTVFSVNSGPKQ